MKKHIFIYFIVFLGLLSCQESERKSAEKLLKRIEYSFENEKFNTAKLQIDSLNLLYRSNVRLRKIANNYLYRIEQIEIERNLAFFSAQIPKKQLTLQSMLQQFTLEKNTAQELGKYIHNSIRGAVNQELLRAQVDESGGIFLTSVYFDRTNCSSKSVRLRSGDFFVLSSMIEPDDQIRDFSFAGDGGRWRILPLSERESEKLAHFVSLYYNDRIVVSLIGNDCFSNYVLDQQQKKAIRESYYLSLLLKEIRELRTNTENSQKQLEIIKRKIAEQK